MATRKVNLPPGFELDPTENLPPGFEIDAVAPTQPQPSLEQFSRNTAADLKANIQNTLDLSAYAFPPMAAAKFAQGENIYNPQRLQAIGTGMVQGVKQMPGQILNSVLHPIDSFYERPLTTALDLSSAFGIGAGVAKLGAAVTGATARKLLPGIARGSAGIPEKATEIALRKPSVLSKPPIPESELNRVVGQPLISAIQETKRAVGTRFGKIYKRYAGMEGPMQEIIDTPVAQRLKEIKTDVPVAQKISPVTTKDPFTGIVQTKFQPGEMINETKVSYAPGQLTTIPRKAHSYDDLLINKNLVKEAFEKGDTQALNRLYREYVGTPKSDLTALNITPKDKLQILTRVKREAQAQADFNKAPVTLKPIDTAKDAAFKKISSDIDEIRSKLPGGKNLALVDDAWKSLNDIYDTIQKDLANPGTAKDTMMRLLRGDNTWLTSGKMKVKTDAIRRVEVFTGKKLLEPAMEELTRQVFSQNMGKGFFPNIVRSGATALAGFGIGTANPAALLGSAASLAASSPKFIGKGIQAASKAGQLISKVPLVPPISGTVLSETTKTLTKEKAKEFLRKAKNNKEKATQLAIEAGYDPYQ